MVDQGRAQRPVGLAHVGELAPSRRVGVPLHGLADLLRHQAQLADDDRLARVERRGVEGDRAAQSERVALDRQRQSGVRRL